MKRLCLLALIGCICLAAGESYSFYYLSDPHFGESGSYAKRADDPTKYMTKKDVFRSDRSRAVYQALFEHIAGTFDDRTRFVVEGGDFIEGFCHDGKTHQEQLQKHWDWMCGILKHPVYPVMGNHDSRGNGGVGAFEAVLGNEIARLTGRPCASGKAQYIFRQGEDLFIVLDYRDSFASRLEYVRDALKSFSGKPRHVFIICHLNFIQMTTGDTALRFLEGIGECNPIVLCGHTHATLLLDYEKEGTRVTQFSLGTMLVPDASACAYKDIREDCEDYFRGHEKYCLARKINFQFVKEHIQPYVKRVWRASGQGMARLDVSDAGVSLSLYGGDVTQAPLKIQVR